MFVLCLTISVVESSLRIDKEKECVFETLMAIKRAGANAIITYYAKQVAKWLNQ